MDLRKIAIVIIALVPAVLTAWGQGLSFGALDFVSASQRNAGVIGALDAVVETAAAKADFSVGALDVVLATKSESQASVANVLSKVAASGKVSSGALDFVRNYHAGGNYYKTGALDVPSLYAGMESANGNASKWIGQMLPVPQWGKITSNFGFRPRFGRMHKGIDIAMNVGDTVCVPIPGVVSRVSYEAGGYGHYVVVKHENGLETRYAHLSVCLVGPGEQVSPDRPIALSGNTGNSTGPHLHFETRVNGTAIDPQQIFNFAGGKVMPRYGSYGAATYSGSPVGALDQVASNGVRGRSLGDKRTYVVKMGDTLEKIAGLAGTSVLEICKLNFISEHDALVPGTMIRLRR